MSEIGKAYQIKALRVQQDRSVIDRVSVPSRLFKEFSDGTETLHIFSLVPVTH